MTSSYSTTSPKISTITIGNRTYRYGERPRVGGFFMREVETGAYRSFPNESTVRWMISRLQAIAGERPEPTPPAAASIRLLEVVRTYAVSDTRKDETKVNIPVQTRGEYKPWNTADDLRAHVFEFERKYRPLTVNTIKVNPRNYDLKYKFRKGIELIVDEAVPFKQAWVGFIAGVEVAA